MRCKCIYIDRGKAIIRTGKYDVTIGEFKRNMFSKSTPFYIPEHFRNITLEQSAFIGSSIMPLFIIDAKSFMVLNYIQNPLDIKRQQIQFKDEKGIEQTVGINLTAESDPTVGIKLKVLIKTSFWEMLAKNLKMGLALTVIYLAAGYGILRFVEYAIRMIVLQQG